MNIERKKDWKLMELLTKLALFESLLEFKKFKYFKFHVNT